MSVIINFTNILNDQVTFIEPEMENTSILYKPMGRVAQIIIPGLKNISVNGIVDNAISDEVSKKIEEATSNLSE